MPHMFNNAKIVYPFTKLQDQQPIDFPVGDRSVVVMLEPLDGEVLSDVDSFELRRVIAIDPMRSILQYQNHEPIYLGSTQPQFEIMIRGDYIVNKILDTVESVGALQGAGFEKI